MKKIMLFFLFIFMFLTSVSFYQPLQIEKELESSFAVLLDGKESSTIPKKEDGYLFETSTCSDGGIAVWDSKLWILSISNILNSKTKCRLSFKKIVSGDSWNLVYSGKESVFSVPVSGKYKLELWGASGGSGYSTFTTTDISLGGKGGYVSIVSSLLSGLYNRKEKLIMVAGAGGGGGGHEGKDVGGYGGGLTGGDGYRVKFELNTGGTQTTGGKTEKSQFPLNLSFNGTFGTGGNSSLSGGGGGGGAGYYGGAGGTWNGGGGGSSYHNTQDFSFLNTSNLGGNETIPDKNGIGTNIGNDGNGYAKITFIGF